MVLFAKGWGRRPQRPKERTEWDVDKADSGGYSNKDLGLLADQFLRDDANEIDLLTGKKRGLKGKNPILFDEHIYDRRRREILNQNGVPEPGLVQGLYKRTHPEGRKVNSKEARARGAAYYR